MRSCIVPSINGIRRCAAHVGQLIEFVILLSPPTDVSRSSSAIERSRRADPVIASTSQRHVFTASIYIRTRRYLYPRLQFEHCFYTIVGIAYNSEFRDVVIQAVVGVAFVP